MSDTVWWTTGSGRIELEIEREHATQGSHPGSCDLDVEEISQLPYIAKQLAEIKPDLLAKELKEYGAWDAEELADHNQNLQRILWIACGDIRDGPMHYQSGLLAAQALMG